MTQTDRQKRELVALRDEDVQARDGLNVVLTLDAAIQHIVETSLADALQKHTPISITAVVMRPRTGEIGDGDAAEFRSEPSRGLAR